MQSVFTDYAIYADYPTFPNATEMGVGIVPRIFSKKEAEAGDAIRRIYKEEYTCTEILLMAGTYRISGFSILTMQLTGAPIETPPNTFPGYCVVYESEHPPKTIADLANCIGLGSPVSAFDTGPSLFDCIYSCSVPTKISVGHQCGYPSPPPPEGQKAYIRVGFVESLFHVFARIAIFKIADNLDRP